MPHLRRKYIVTLDLPILCCLVAERWLESHAYTSVILEKLCNFVKGNNAIRLESHRHRNLHALDIILEILMGNFKDSSSFEADWKNTSNAKTICYSNGGIYCRLRSPRCSAKSVAGVNKHQLKKNQSALWANSWINTWFFGLCLMLSGLGNFVVDCHI